MKKGRLAALRRRLEAAALAAGTLWVVWAAGPSPSAAGAVGALGRAGAAAALRWELGALPEEGGALSPAAVVSLGEAPALLERRAAVLELWSLEEAEPDEHTPAPVREEDAPPPEEGPPEEPAAPLPAPDTEDNGVPARTLVPTGPEGYTVWGRVYISPSQGRTLPPQAPSEPFAAELTADAPQVLILHTHGSEAYTPAPGTEVVWSGDCRTTDPRYSVVRVGDEMASVFAEAGISVLHDRTLYDYPNYTGSYDRSLAAIESYLAQYPSIRFILDVHRDAIEDAQGREYKVISETPEGTAAQLTLVVGSDGSGAPHPDWLENLKLAAAIQEQVLTDYPTLMRPLLLRNSRYNQHTAPGALLVEVGAAGNAPEEAWLAGRLFAREMARVLEDRSK